MECPGVQSLVFNVWYASLLNGGETLHDNKLEHYLKIFIVINYLRFCIIIIEKNVYCYVFLISFDKIKTASGKS